MSRADDNHVWDEWLGSRSTKFYNIMVVEFNTGGANYIPVRQASARRTDATAPDSDADDSSVSFSTQAMQQTLQQMPASRPEKVAQAASLANDPNYPSDQALNQLAGFLANRL